MSSEVLNALTVSFDGSSWQAMDQRGHIQLLCCDEESGWPELHDDMVISRVVLPVEQLLARTISLPLSHPRFIDQDILGQEIEELTGEEPENWWLSWHTARVEEGVTGLLFGLPDHWRQKIDEHAVWKQVGSISVDCWDRLNHLISAEQFEPQRKIAVFDADTEGLFFGLWDSGRGKAEGFWSGMRRLNLDDDTDLADQSENMAEQIKRSLLSMGWHESDAATGRLEPVLLASLGLHSWQGETIEQFDLPERQLANLISVPSAMNFRHGRWAARSGENSIKPWYRSLALAAAVAVIWIAATSWQNYRLSNQIDVLEQRITAAFHQGLPNEPVMIDALAQLRKAAGNQSNDVSSSTVKWLQHMAVINKVKKDVSWEITLLNYQNGKMVMSGFSKDLQTMNKIRSLLQSQVGDVKLEDSDLSGKKVKFRMVWS